MPRPGRLAAMALAASLTTALLLVPAAARADGLAGAPPADYGPPPTPPAGNARDEEDQPRRDVRLGNVDHMRLGREDDGSVIMEVRPRPKQTQEQQQVGPFYIYPQIGGSSGIQVGPGSQPGGSSGIQVGPGGQPGSSSSGRPGQGQSGGPGQFGPGGPGGQNPMPGQGQRPPLPPFGQPGQPGQPGQLGQPGLQGQPPGGQGAAGNGS